MKAKIFVVDPGTRTGWASNYAHEEYAKALIQLRTDYTKLDITAFYGHWDIKTKAKTKKSPAEPKHLRLVKLYDHLIDFRLDNGKPDIVVLEDAAGFTRGKAATMAMHEFRAIVKLWCGSRIPLHLIQPADVKRFAVGKGTATKEEMIEAAQRRYGYIGDDDNEADALHMLAWAEENLT